MAEDTVLKGIVRHGLSTLAGVIVGAAAVKGLVLPAEAVETTVSGLTEIVVPLGLWGWSIGWSILAKTKKRVGL